MKSHSLIPSYWKNGLRKNLSKPKHGDGEAKDIQSVNNRKFIGGTTSAPHDLYVVKPMIAKKGLHYKLINLKSLENKIISQVVVLIIIVIAIILSKCVITSS